MRADCCADHVDVDERWNSSERGRGMTQAAFLLFVFLKQFYIKVRAVLELRICV